MNQSTKIIQKLSKVIKSDNFCYRKVGRAITKWGAIEKSPIGAIAILEKLPLSKGSKNYFSLMVAIIFSPTVRVTYKTSMNI